MGETSGRNDRPDQPQVENPRLAALKTLRAGLIAESENMRALLATAATDVGGKGAAKSWVGPTADKWHTDLVGHRTQIKADVDRLIPAVDAEIAKCPEKVSQGEAKAIVMYLQGY